MTSLVSDGFVNSVPRQARRLSCSNLSNEPESATTPARVRQPCSSIEDVLSQTEKDPCIAVEREGSTPTALSSQRSAPPALPAETPEALSQAMEQDHVYADNPELAIQSIVLDELAGEEPGSRRPRSDNASNRAGELSSRDYHIPEDDGHGSLRRRIIAIQNQDVPGSQKARLMHELLSEGYISSQARLKSTQSLAQPNEFLPNQLLFPGPSEPFRFWQHSQRESSPIRYFALTEDDVRPTFAPKNISSEESGESFVHEDEPSCRALGCEHYRRNVKLQCSTCSRWYTCRFCHDRVEDHALARKETKNMLCMFCGTAQRAGEVCVNCGESSARYYCNVCKLWNDDPDKNIYHCSGCGICRIGRGLGKDFFHCKRCFACIAIAMENDHKCIERATDCDCPICGEYMFTSPKAVCFMKCGHSIHRECFEEYTKTSYKCPICSKSVTNMETQFRRLDRAIEAQPMPPEFRITRAVVLCNDCSAKSSVQYHWLGLKCAICQSYNTSELQTVGEGVEINETLVAGSDVLRSRAIGLAGAGRRSSGDHSGSPALFSWRRHSSSLEHSVVAGLSLGAYQSTEVNHDTLNQSTSSLPSTEVSEITAPSPGPRAPSVASEDEEDIIGFWNRVPGNVGSNEDLIQDAVSEHEPEFTDVDETDQEDDDNDNDNDGDSDGGDDDDTDIVCLPGHR